MGFDTILTLARAFEKIGATSTTSARSNLRVRDMLRASNLRLSQEGVSLDERRISGARKWTSNR